jgi:hypothetical protein
MPLSPQDQARLSALYKQRDLISGGQAPSEVEFAGQRTAFSKPDMSVLDRSIQELEAKARSRTGRARGAVGFRRL